MTASKPNPPPEILISTEALDERLDTMAAEIDRDYAESERLVAVGVLKGSVFFMVDLLKRVQVPLAMDFFQTSSYGDSTEPGEVRIRKDIDLSVRGADVLLIEDMGARRFGDQLRGCDAERAERVVRWLARFHASKWGEAHLAERA